MLQFNLEKPVAVALCGRFSSPERDWKHLTRSLVDYELMIVYEGELYIGDAAREYRVPAGEYLIMPPTPRQHGTRVCKCKFYWLHFQCPAQPATLSLPRQGRFDDFARIEEICEALIKQDGIDHRGAYSCYLATELLFELAQQSGLAERATGDDAQKQLVARVKEYVEFRRFSQVNITELAKELGYHEKYISSVFSKNEGITLKKYIAQVRVAEAKRLLAEADYTVTEVAYYLNYTSPHNFCRFFKNETGFTPLEWKRRG